MSSVTTAPAPATRTPDMAELASRLRLAVTRLSRLLRQQGDSGLSPTLLAALATVEASGALTLGELAAREQVAPPTITKAVSGLEEQGYVVRRPDTADRRVVRVEITPTGRKLLDRTRTRRNAWLNHRLRTLSPGEIAILAAAADVLERLGEPDPSRPRR